MDILDTPYAVHHLPGRATRPAFDSAQSPGVVLSKCKRGERVTVLSFSGSAQMQNRLESVGIHLGQELTIFRSARHGGTVVDGMDMRLALDRQLAEQILVVRV